MKMIRIGFVVDGQVPTLAGCLRRGNLWALLVGWGSRTPVAEMRFRWIAEYVNRYVEGVRYELYRPWQRYQAVVFLKSMNSESMDLQRVLRRQGTRTVFDANVDYFSEAAGTFFYEGMAPSKEQQSNALIMAGSCDGVIADSSHIAEVVRQINGNTTTITDNVLDRLVTDGSVWRPDVGKPLELIWCGQAVKLFELLAVREVLSAWRDRIVLKIITNSLEYTQKWYSPYSEEFGSLLRDIRHRIVPFTSIEALMAEYDAGGVFIAPRFLNNSYNLGHTEWKITLALARGRFVLCSPQPSYREVWKLSRGKGIRLCESNQEWLDGLKSCLSKDFDWGGEQEGAIAVVREHFTTKRLAEMHLAFLRSLIKAH